MNDRKTPLRPGRRQRGLALVLVLWSTALLAVMAAGFAFSVRTEVRMASNLESHAQAHALAEAGVQRVMVALSSSDGGALARDGRPQQLTLASGEVTVEIRPETGKLDINAAPPLLIQGLFEALAEDDASLDKRDAARLSDTLLDWLDDDDAPRPDGAESDAYERAGLDFRPRNGAMVALSELRQVAGMTEALYRRLEPVLTVHSRRPQLDANSADRLALLALPGLSAERVDAFVAEREKMIRDNPRMLQVPGFVVARNLGPAMRYLSTVAGSVYTVDAVGSSAGGARARLRVVVRLTETPEMPVAIVAWDDSPDSRETDDTR